MLQPKKVLQTICCNLKRRYQRDAVTLRDATSEILQPEEALQARCCNLNRCYKRDTATSKGATKEKRQPEGTTSEIIKPEQILQTRCCNQRALQANSCNLKRCYKRDFTTSRGASEMLQPKEVLRRTVCNLVLKLELLYTKTLHAN